jgi:aspartate/methionine/tyrosine aminotransferase
LAAEADAGSNGDGDAVAAAATATAAAAAAAAAPPPSSSSWASSRVPSRPCAFTQMSRHKQAARTLLGPTHPLFLDLSIGSSDLRPHQAVLEALRDAALNDPDAHAYGLRPSTLPFLRAATDWFAREFGGEAHARSAAQAAAAEGGGGGSGVQEQPAPPPPPPPPLRSLDVDREALALIGAQEGLAHLLLAVCEPREDAVLLSDVAYPPYASACDVASVEARTYGLKAAAVGGGAGGLLPDLDALDAQLQREKEAERRPRVLLINMPQNPTGAVPSYRFWRRALDFCDRWDLLLVSDNPYAALVFPEEEQEGGATGGQQATARPSLAAARAMGFLPQDALPDTLTAPGALAYALYENRGREQRVVELFSLSKSHLMGGMRLGFALGSRSAVAALEAVKAPVDFNQWRGLLKAGEVALRLPASESTWVAAREYGRRARALAEALRREARWDVAAEDGRALPPPVAAMYVWARLPRGWRRARRAGAAGGGNNNNNNDDDDDDDDAAFCRDLVVATGVAVAPGSGFGEGGRGRVRFALVAPAPDLQRAAAAVGAFLRGEV